MKKYILALLFVGFLFTACSKENKEANTNSGADNKIEVVEHMDGGGYTFIKGKNNGKEIWIAVRQMKVKDSDEYYFSDAMEMKNFESKSLNRTFESILFVNTISSTSKESSNKPHGGMSRMMNSADGHTKPQVKENSEIKIEPLKDGMSIANVNKNRVALAGKRIKIKGVVTKYNGGIMGRNWIHIQDGSKYNNFVDITVTSDESAKVGETIIIEGTVSVDKDFGAGYFYNVIVENAKITKVEDI